MIANKVALFVIKGMQSYSTVGEPVFRSLLNRVTAKYVVPAHVILSGSIVPEGPERAKERTECKLHSIFKESLCCYAVKTESSTSRARDSYVSLMVHVLQEDCMVHNFMTACWHMRDDHLKKNLKTVLETVTEGWRIPAALLRYIATDNYSILCSRITALHAWGEEHHCRISGP